MYVLNIIGFNLQTVVTKNMYDKKSNVPYYILVEINWIVLPGYIKNTKQAREVRKDDRLSERD